MLNFDNNFDELENSLDRDISWRVKELINLQNEIDSKFELNNQEVSFLIRGSIALIYAHWEGSIKSQLSHYVKFLNNLLKEKYLELENYDDEILDLLFQPTIKILGHNTKEKRLKGIKNFKQLYFNQNILTIDSKEVVNTKSNLSFEVLTKLFKNFKIKELDNINTSFIEQLLKDRNAIAHGERRYTEVNLAVKQKIADNSKKIEILIKEVKNNILEKAESYRKMDEK